MKKICLLFVLLIFAAFAASCGDSYEAPISDATITITDNNGEKADIDVDEDTDVSSYRIIRADTASQSTKQSCADIRMAILEKTGIKVDLVTDWNAVGSSEKEIIVGKTTDALSASLTEKLGKYDFSITKKDNRIYVLGGSDESIAEAAALFAKCFVYKDNKSLLLPIDDGYTFTKKFAFDKLTVDGTDISEFSIYCTDKITVDHSFIKTVSMANDLSELIETKLTGAKLPVSEEMGEGHYIVLTASGLDADEYSVRIENGNIYIDGSFVSFDSAYEAFISEVLGYKEGESELMRTLDLTSKNDMTDSLGFTVPYTKQELAELFAEASESKEMVISGTHCYKGGGRDGWVSSTAGKVYEASGQTPAIIELDVGRHSVYFDYYYKGEIINPYDLSSFVSESAKHVSEGGIISVCIHMANPLMNASDNVWYRGHLGSEETAVQLLTEGTELNAAFRKTLESTFMLIKALDDNGIPFMFRPLHEMNGGWFWWCVDQGGENLSQTTMQELWKYLYNIVTVEMGIDDVLWVYAPNYNTGTLSDVLYAYPGDEYVDIVGCDWYTNGNYEINTKDSFTKIMSTGKPSALTEVGPASGGALSAIDADGKTYYTWTCEDLLGAIKDMIRDDFKVSYFLTWTHNMSIYGLGDADILMNDDIILSREDILERWNTKK